MESKIAARAKLMFFLFGAFLIAAFIKLGVSPVPGVTGRRESVVLPPRRGNIEDRKGRLLASSEYSYRAFLDVSFLLRDYVNAEKAKDTEKLTKIDQALALLGESTSTLAASGVKFLLLSVSRNREDLFNPIPPALIPYTSVEMYARRKYVSAASIKTVLGSVIEGKGGKGGVEEYLDEILRGKKAGRMTFTYQGYITLQPKEVDIEEPRNGENVRLSIDMDIQRIVYSEIVRAVKEHNANGGNAIVMEVKTGKILAMVTTKNWNDNVLGYIEPGSTIKPVIYSIALQTGAATPGFHHFCTGRIKPVEWLDVTIGDIKAHGEVDFRKALVESCNTATVKIAGLIKRKIGQVGMYEWLRKFGFGERTGIEIAGESKGVLRNPEEWSAIDYAEIAIGQGIGVTPLQLIAAINAIVNGGVYVKPTILMNSSPVTRRILSKSVADYIRSIMVDVVEKGTGERAKIAGLKIAGKTGTAQKAIGGKYVKRYHSIFIGAFPADDPEYIILVHIDDPRKGEYLGGDVAAPVFRRIVLDMMQMKKEKPIVVYPGVTPDLKGLSLKDVLSISSVLGVNVKVHGCGIVVKQIPLPGRPLEGEIEVWMEEPRR